MFIRVILISALSLFMTLSADDELKEIYKTGNEVSMKLLKNLGKNLKKEMKSSGIVGAIEFCHTNAYPLAEKFNSNLPEGISVKRVSSKYRNPVNKPLQDEEKILKAIEDSFEVTPKGLLQEVSEGEYKFYKPLRIAKPVCLKCHGNSDQIPAPIQKFLKENYPEDRAVDYKMRDLRGAIVVTIKKPVTKDSETAETEVEVEEDK